MALRASKGIRAGDTKALVRVLIVRPFTRKRSVRKLRN
jgi:hypothetical protein